MAIGDLLGKLKGQEKQEPKKFLALLLTDEIVQAAVWRVIEGVTETVAQGAPVEWDGDTGTTNELITAVDATISSAVEGIEGEINEVILGIPTGWTDKNGVLGSKREFIKSINKELELKPLGYVTITDSVLTYLKMQEGTPATSILIQVSRDELTIILVRLGRIEGVEVVGRSEDDVEDVVTGISHFPQGDNLPSRIILFNNMHNLDEMIQNLLAGQWQEQFKFLHMPKIEALPKDIAIRSLAVAGGSEVARSLGFAVYEPKPEVSEEVEVVTEEEIGFGEIEPEIPKLAIPKVKLPKLTLPKFTLPKLTLPKIKQSLGRKGVIALGALVLGVGLIAAVVWSVPGATITVTVTSKMMDLEVDLTLSTQVANTNLASGVVPAKLETVKASGEKMQDTTGKQTVGEKAKGEVTIYNRTSLNKILTKGTVISSGSLKFTLDSDVNVASGSASNDYVGKANVAITASAIGEASNLVAGTELLIASFGRESYVAKNETALTGGTSEEVRVVAKEDRAALLTELTNELKQQLETQVTAAGGEATYLIPSSIKIENEVYSAKVGEEANSVGLEATIIASILRYQTSEVSELINATITSTIPAGYVRAELPTQVELTAETVDSTGETVSGRAKVKIPLLPEWDERELAKKLAGVSKTEVESILREKLVGLVRIEMSTSPRYLPPRITKLPFNAQKIRIVVVAE